MFVRTRRPRQGQRYAGCEPVTMTRAAARRSTTKKAGAHGSKGRANGYDAAKEFEGQRYTGMKVGRGHKWHYDRGVWSERKVTPDDWTFEYAVTKRRAGRAPEGSGAPVGTEYHWFILADQLVAKLDANSYSTDMKGWKIKLAHKRAGSAKWSAGERARRRRLIGALRAMIVRLEGDLLVDAEPASKAARGPASGASS